MNCAEILKRLSAYADDEVTDEEKCVIAEHLKVCTQCQIELERLQQVAQSLDAVEDVDTPPYFIVHLKQKLADQQSEGRIGLSVVKWIKRVTVPAFAAVCIIAALITGSTLGKILYRTQVESIGEQETRVARFLGISSLDEVTQGPVASSLEDLLVLEEQ
jgi:anti-sigma factor RsiW